LNKTGKYNDEFKTRFIKDKKDIKVIEVIEYLNEKSGIPKVMMPQT